MKNVANHRAGRGTWGRVVLLGVVLAVAEGMAGRLAAAAVPDFTREIRPILSENCFTCHGPDEKQRKAKYRVDVKDSAFKSAKGDPIIVPGKSGESEFIRRVTTHDEDDIMPPAKTGRKLTASQVDLLRRWVDAGAKWDEHWAFVAPQRPAEAEVRDVAWPRNAIDRFVLARLEKEELKPNPEADRPTLIRRATFDLTGLPPTVEEVDAFLKDSSGDAYEKVVNRLLDSPRYGEHMARYWMDAVRYADTHGYHIDSQRDIWAYREWVIKAFNRNLPFDRFTTEQLAGDLLPNPTVDQKIATGFVRCNMSTGEGGVIEDEYRAKYAFDRVETLGTVWLGATLLCSRCHTHKYDPYPQAEYYGLYSFFNNLDEPVMDGNKPNPDPFLKLPSPEQSSRLAWLQEHVRDLDKRMAAPMPELDAAQPAWEARWQRRLQEQLTLLTPVHAEASRTGGLELAIRGDGTVGTAENAPVKAVYETVLSLSPGRLSALKLDILPGSTDEPPATAAVPESFGLSEFEAELIPAPSTNAEAKPKPIKFSRAFADSHAEGSGIERAIDGKADTAWSPRAVSGQADHHALFVLNEPLDMAPGMQIKVRLRQESPRFRATIPRFRVWSAQQSELAQYLFPPKPSPWKVIGPFPSDNTAEAFSGVHPAEKELDFSKSYPGVRDSVSWRDQPEFEDGKSRLLVQDLHGVHGVRLFHRVLNSPRARETEMSLMTEAWFKVWLNGELVGERAREARPGEPPFTARLKLREGNNVLLVKLISIQGATYFQFHPDRTAPENLPADVAGILLTSPKPGPAEPGPVRHHFRRRQSAEYRAWSDDVVAMRDETERIERAIPTTLVAKEASTPRATHLLMRGEYDKPAQKVSPAVLGALGPFPKDAPTNRLGLARWLLDSSNPLTARVTVNRFWSQYFGAGLVRTVEDFGSQGDRPSHPELLDWLATEFVRTGWDIKGLQKLIVMSATYRQSSKSTPAQRARDPENRLLGRGPRFRMDAEVVRDTFLAIGGLLGDRIGGPSARPYEPPGLWEAVSFNNSQKYVQDRTEAQYRRSLYTFWKRQSPPPAMLVLDAPTRETCTVRRPRTNTPLQALATLNDPQFVEAARAFAARILRHAGSTPEDRIAHGFRLATGRTVQPDEMAVLKSVLEKSRAEYQADPAAAKAFLTVGDYRADGGWEPAELAAWTSVANLILNLDETLTKL